MEKQQIISEIKRLGGLEKIKDLLEQMTKLSACVMGEPIIDTYTFCRPEALSSKYPAISARFSKTENYLGGSLAIANHLADFCDVTALCLSGTEEYYDVLLNEHLDKRIKYIGIKVPDYQTPRKTRFIDDERNQRVFELTNIASTDIPLEFSKKLCDEMFDQGFKRDLLIFSDFGHGCFSKPVLEAISKMCNFKALNVQTNSSNYGFNVFTKHKSFSYLTLDLKEARLAFNDRYSTAFELCKRMKESVRLFSMTLGPNGSYLFDASEQCQYCPAFAEKIIDTTGAGDAYFAITSLLVRVNAPPLFVPFIGNVFAGLKTKIVGNKRAISKQELSDELERMINE